MRVEQLMTKSPKTCRPEDTLSDAAQVMLENDCGYLPVTSGEHSQRLLGVLTDRDICMAAQVLGRTLKELRVRDAMMREVHVCHPVARPAAAEAIMREAQVRRLPVVDGSGRLVGVLSLTDLARQATRARSSENPEITEAEIGQLLATICEHRGTGLTVSAGETASPVGF
jgi:CBS domain-containing protein